MVAQTLLAAQRCLGACRRPAQPARAFPKPGYAPAPTYSRASTCSTLQRGRGRCLRINASAIDNLNAEELEQAIQDRDTPIIIDFFATWCGPCVILANELEKVAQEMGAGVRIVKVDVDRNPDLASQLQIKGLPTLIFVGLDPGKPALRTEGTLPAETIMDIVRTEMS